MLRSWSRGWVRMAEARVGWGTRQWRKLFLPVDQPTRFQDKAAVTKALTGAKVETLPALLAEAQEIFAEPLARAEGVERRATTLVGAVGIAASFSVAAAALLGSNKDLGTWRYPVAVGFFLVVLCFAMSGYRALQAMSRIHPWTFPEDNDILDRATMSLAGAQIDRAASLLKSSGANDPVARWKVAHLGAATHWLVCALVTLVATALVLGAFVVFGPSASDSHADNCGRHRSPRGAMHDHAHPRWSRDRHCD